MRTSVKDEKMKTTNMNGQGYGVEGLDLNDFLN
jgi:hypothetical protein